MASDLVPGTGKHATVTNPTGLAGSVSQNPLAPVEYGRTAAKSKYTTVTSSAPLGPEFIAGPIATVTLVGTTSTKADGTETDKATTSDGVGTGATVSYAVATNVASGLVVVSDGINYQVGDTLTVVGDTGVTATVASLA